MIKKSVLKSCQKAGKRRVDDALCEDHKVEGVAVHKALEVLLGIREVIKIELFMR